MALSDLRTISLMLVAAISGYSQSAKSYPEPCPPFPFFAEITKDSLINRHAYCWMIDAPIDTAAWGHIYSIDISIDFPSGINYPEEANHTVHINSVPFSRVKSVQQAREEHLQAEIPGEIGLLIGKAWRTVLRHTKYEEPKEKKGVVIGGRLDGPIYYFGFEGSRIHLSGRYFGRICFDVNGEALLIQTLGHELQRFVRSDPSQRALCLQRIREISSNILAQQKSNDD